MKGILREKMIFKKLEKNGFKIESFEGRND